MNTGCFFTNKNKNSISIAISAPKWYNGESYEDLFPTWAILNKYKIDKDEDAYTKAYHEEILSKLDPQKVYNDLKGKVILCWEKTGEFCHRHIVAKWLKDSLGVEITEI